MLRLEYGRMLQDGLDGAHGLSRPQLQELVRKFGAVRDEVRTRRAAGEYGFYGLAEQGATIKSIIQFAGGIGQAYDHVLVLGIGGSALGARALLSALRRPPGTNSTMRAGTSIPSSRSSRMSIRAPCARHSAASTRGACSSTW